MDPTEDLSARVLLGHILSTEPPRTPVTRSSSRNQSTSATRRSSRLGLKDASVKIPRDILRHKMRESVTRKSLTATKSRASSGVFRKMNTSASMLLDSGATPRHILMNILRTEPVKSPVAHKKAEDEEPRPSSANSKRPSTEFSGLDLPDLTIGSAASIVKRLSRKRPHRSFNITAFEKRLKEGDDAVCTDVEEGNEESVDDHSLLSLSSTSLSLKTPYVDARTEKRGLLRRVSHRRKITEEEFGAAVNERHTRGRVSSFVERSLGDTAFPESFTLGFTKLGEPDDVTTDNTALYAQPDAMTSNFSTVATQDKPTVHPSPIVEGVVAEPQNDESQSEDDADVAESGKISQISAVCQKSEGEEDCIAESLSVRNRMGKSDEEENGVEAETEEEIPADSQTEDDKEEEVESQHEEECTAKSQSEEEVTADSQNEEEEEEEGGVDLQHEEECTARSQSEEEVAADSQNEEEEEGGVDLQHEEECTARSQSEEEVAADSQNEEEEEEEGGVDLQHEEECTARSQSEEEVAADSQNEEEEEEGGVDLQHEEECTARSQSEEEVAADSQNEGEEEGAVDSQYEEEENAAENPNPAEAGLDDSQDEEKLEDAMEEEDGEHVPEQLESDSEHISRRAHRSGGGVIPVTEEGWSVSKARAHTTVDTQNTTEMGSHESNLPHSGIPDLVEPSTQGPADASHTDAEAEDSGHQRSEDGDAQEAAQQEEEWEDEDGDESDEVPSKTPKFVREKRHFFRPDLDVQASTSGNVPTPKPKQATKRNRSAKKEGGRGGGLPKSYLMSVFKHFAKTKVSADVYPVLKDIMDKFFERMADDLETYAVHAKRKTIEVEDAELLLKRQGYVNDKTPVEVLIEKYLRMDQRKLLIPIATSGNFVIPKRQR